MTHFVYHPHHEPVIVETAEYQTYLDNGWYDSPAKFPPVSEEIKDAVDAVPKKKGRPPKAKAEEMQLSCEP